MTSVNLILTTSDYILLQNRQPDLRKSGQKNAASEMTFTKRLLWVASLLATPTGLNGHMNQCHGGNSLPLNLFGLYFYCILFDITVIHI